MATTQTIAQQPPGQVQAKAAAPPAKGSAQPQLKRELRGLDFAAGQARLAPPPDGSGPVQLQRQGRRA